MINWRESEGKWSREEDLGMSSTSKLIRGLRCAATYEIRVVAKSTAGESSPASANARTLGDGKIHSLVFFHIFLLFMR